MAFGETCGISSDFVRLRFRALCPRRSKVSIITVLAPLDGNQMLRCERLITQAGKTALSCPHGTTYLPAVHDER